jgi:EAL domain-containing protein (putative c-di-GMP-specific phosphodiesterase class I)
MIEFWDRYCSPERWQFYRLERQQSLPSSLPDPVDWRWIVDHRPLVWIDTLIEQGAIRMFRQPIVELGKNDGSRIIGYELLARGEENTGEIIPPLVLIQEARSQNRLFHLDRACRISAIRTVTNRPENVVYFINFIPSVIYVAEHCLETTMAAIRDSTLTPDQIVFEVTESEFVEDPEHLKSILTYYRKNGFRYALDDVGEGYNTIERLRFLEPDIVKLDRKWVSGVHNHPDRQDKAKEVFDAARETGATCLAEGVEDPEEALVLKQIGYSWQQGYLYGKPAPFPDRQ